MTAHIQLPANTAWSHLETVPPEERQEARSVAFTYVHYTPTPYVHHPWADAGRALLAIAEFAGMFAGVMWLIHQAMS